MRFLLDGKHYVDDQFLEAGVIVGDAAEGQPAPVHTWRHARENKNKGITAGQAMRPSNMMIPLDDEAKKMFRDEFGEEPPSRDPYAAIPLQGNVVQHPINPTPPPTSTPRGRDK